MSTTDFNWMGLPVGSNTACSNNLEMEVTSWQLR